MIGYIKKIQDGCGFREFMLKRIVRLLPLVAIAAVIYGVVGEFIIMCLGVGALGCQ